MYQDQTDQNPTVMPPKLKNQPSKVLGSFPKDYIDDGKFSRLKKMGAEKLAMVDALIVSGTPDLQIAKTIQDEWKQVDDVSMSALAKMISRYRLNRVDLGNASIMIAEEVEARVGNQLTELKDLEKTFKRRDLDVLDELAGLFLLQKNRIDDTRKKEISVGVPFPTLTKDIVLQKDILHEISELQFDMGINERHAKPQNGASVNVYNTNNSIHTDGARKYLESKRKQENYMTVTAEIMQILGDGDTTDESRTIERNQIIHINESQSERDSESVG